MNDLTIHEGLTEADIRDAISNGFIEATFYNKEDSESISYPQNGSQTDKLLYLITKKKGEIKSIEIGIEAHQKMLGLVTLMEFKGWSEHDVSDKIPRGGEYYRSFIGTGKEHKKLIDSLK